MPPATPTSTPTSVLPWPSPTLDSSVDLKVEEICPVPNPQTGPVLVFRLKLRGGADQLEFKLYTRAETAVLSRIIQGPFPPGWCQVALPLDQALPGGGYYALITAKRNSGEAAKSGIAKLYYMN